MLCSCFFLLRVIDHAYQGRTKQPVANTIATANFFEHLVLLPRIRLQKNNPAKHRRTGDGVNFVVDYTYSYDVKNRPLTKRGNLQILTGTDAGKFFQTNSAFSYYD